MLLRAKEMDAELARLAATADSEVRAAALPDLQAVILLAGSVRTSTFRRSIHRFTLDLPIEPTLSIFDGWQIQLTHLARFLNRESLAVRVMVDSSAPPPANAEWSAPLCLRVERDPLEFRGTGGLLRDIARQYEDDAYMLVADGAQVSFDPIALLVESMARPEADVTILARKDGTPRGLMLVRCGAFKDVSDVGYIDLKEQLLPRLRCRHDVRVVAHGDSASFPIRTMREYIGALREYHRRQRGDHQERGPFGEDWSATFSIIEPGASVHPSAIIHDSVILSGAEVQNEAVVVRSVVCPGGVVVRKRDAVDCVVQGRGLLVHE